MTYQTDALYGDADNYSALPADMLNVNADGAIDWNALLAGGIRGAAQAAIATRVNGAYASGQLVAPNQAQASNAKLMNLLLIGAVIYAVMQA